MENKNVTSIALHKDFINKITLHICYKWYVPYILCRRGNKWLLIFFNPNNLVVSEKMPTFALVIKKRIKTTTNKIITI